MNDPVPFSPFPLRRSSTIPLPISTSIDPRLQTQPQHSLGPWPLSRTVSNSSNSSSNTSGLRSRAGSSASRHNDPLSPEITNPLEGIDEILEMQMKTTNDSIARRRFGESLTEAEDEGDGASLVNTQEPGPDFDTEQALKREIFSIHNALEHKSSSSSTLLSTTNSLTTSWHHGKTLSYFPQNTTTPLHIDLALSHFQKKPSGTVQSRDANSVALTLTLSLLDPPLGSADRKAAIPFSFSHLQPGDTVTLVDDVAGQRTNTNTSVSVSATQHQHQCTNQNMTNTDSIPPPSYHIATTARATGREPSVDFQSICINTSIPTYVYVLSVMLMLAFPPTTYFFLHHLTSASSPTSSPFTITFIFMTLLTLNAFIIGVLFWITGTCLVLLISLREGSTWKSDGKGEKKESTEKEATEQMTKVKDAVYHLLQLKYKYEHKYQTEVDPELISPTMNWIFGAVIVGLWCVSWYVPWVMSMMEWAEH